MRTIAAAALPSERGAQILGAYSDGGSAVVAGAANPSVASALAADPGFSAARGQGLRVLDGVRLIYVVGLGDRGSLTAQVLREASMSAAAALDGIGFTNALALDLDDSLVAVRAVVEGTELGCYRYRRAGAEAAPPREWRLVLPDGVAEADAAATIDLALDAADAGNWVRQLVETPGNLLGPTEFADAIEARAARLAPSLEVTRWSTADLAARGFGATLAVGAGSQRPPLVIELRTPGDGTPIGLAGKGITFDAGGINIKKDSGELAWMKSDMAAAASVAAAVIALAARGSDVPMHAILPIAENMPSGAAVRPGDVVTHPGGRTTEVTDTDCEGRLVLADAIAYLAATSPTAIIDVGTLTDSGALGTAYWGCWSTAPSVAAALVRAGEIAGEPGWLLPLHESYPVLLKSAVADSVNWPVDAPDTGQVAATYLSAFAGAVPWVHVDNGSGAYLEWEVGPWPIGATGTPVRALIEFLSSQHEAR